MEVVQSHLDPEINHTLRIELINGKVFFYPLDPDSKEELADQLLELSEGFNSGAPVRFIIFNTSLDRVVMVNVEDISRITFVYDEEMQFGEEEHGYFDNFGVLGEDEETDEAEDVEDLNESDIPQLILYHRGTRPEDEYDDNPLVYDSLEDGCLGDLSLEIQSEDSLRQFIYLKDDDGELSFIATKQVMLMEFDGSLLDEEDIEDLEGEEGMEDAGKLN
jgi:hypothetical protein